MSEEGAAAHDQYILRKLERELLPYIATGSLLSREWFVILGMFFRYANDIISGLIGVGLAAPMLILLNSNKSGNTGFENQLGRVQDHWPEFLIAVVWILIRVIVANENVVARTLLAKDCGKQLRRQYRLLVQQLKDPNPIRAINKIQEAIDKTVDNAVQNEIWRWEPLPDRRHIASEIDRMLSHIQIEYSHYWDQPPPGSV
jgi:hypothetical protein